MKYVVASVKQATLVLFCSATLAAVPALAQTDTAPPPPPSGQADGYGGGGGPHRGGPERRVEMMQHELNLSSDQSAQLKSIMAGEHSKMEALHSNSSLSQADMRSQMMAIHQASDSQIRAMLTPDQVTKYDAMQAHMRARMQERRNDGDAAPPAGPPPAPQD